MFDQYTFKFNRVLWWASSLFLILLLASCHKISALNYSSNEIDLEPILQLDLPLETEDDLGAILDIEKLESLEQTSFPPGQSLSTRGLSVLYIIQDEPEDEILFDLHFFLHKDIETAHSSNQRKCNDPYREQPLELQDEGTVNGVPYHYCVYMLQLARGGAESFRKSLNYYYSTVYIQKGNLTITISEQTETLDRGPSNETIKLLAELMRAP